LNPYAKALLFVGSSSAGELDVPGFSGVAGA
jgi:hypothetical protein